MRTSSLDTSLHCMNRMKEIKVTLNETNQIEIEILPVQKKNVSLKIKHLLNSTSSFFILSDKLCMIIIYTSNIRLILRCYCDNVFHNNFRKNLKRIPEFKNTGRCTLNKTFLSTVLCTNSANSTCKSQCKLFGKQKFVI